MRPAGRRPRGARGGQPLPQPARAPARRPALEPALALLRGARRPARRAAGHTLRSVGVDAWGVDYALLDERGRVLGLPFHYRDERTVGHGRARAMRACPREAMYRTHRHPDDADQHGLPAARRGGRREPRGGLAHRARARSARQLAQRRGGERGHGGLDDRAARCPQRPLGGRADRAARAAVAHLRRDRRARHARRRRCSPTTSSATCPCAPLPPTTRPRRSWPRRCAIATPPSSRAARGRCSALEVDEPVLDEDASASTSPTSAASTARRACCAT